MALYHVDYYSLALAGQTDFYAVIPNDVPPFMADMSEHYKRPAKVLVLLHGYSGNSADWVTGSRIRELSQEIFTAPKEQRTKDFLNKVL